MHLLSAKTTKDCDSATKQFNTSIFFTSFYFTSQLPKKSLQLEHLAVLLFVLFPWLTFQDCDVVTNIRSSHPEEFLGKGVLDIYSKFTGEHPCRSVISIKLQKQTSAWVFSCKFVAPNFTKNTSKRLLLKRSFNCI